MKKRKFFSTSTGYTILVCVLLLIASIGISSLIILRLRTSIKEMVSNRMLNIANTAAAVVDAEKVKSFIDNPDKEGNDYKAVYETLDDFKANIQFKYIYIVKYAGVDQNGQNYYTYVIDQDPIDPAEFGEEIVFTDALNSAGSGKPAVDLEAVADEWGTFYSAFSPIYDKNNVMVGIVGIDFESVQYENEISRQNSGIVVVEICSLIIGGLIALVFSRRVLKKYHSLNQELTSLSKDIDALNQEISIKQSEVYLEDDNAKEEMPNNDKDTVEDLIIKMSIMQQELHRYVDYVHAQAYVDSMTGVSSKTAYLELVKDIENKIVEKTADFKVIVFDVNGLKAMNDNFGHEYGDMLIINTAKVIMSLYDRKRVFRIGGDEFIVIIEDETDKTLEENEYDINQAIELFNSKLKEGDVKVSCSFGGAHYNPRIDDNYKHVFKRADEEMYHFKALYYQKMGDRRKH